MVNRKLNKGDHFVTWNGKDELGNVESSGIYFYKLRLNKVDNQIMKCILLK